MKKFVGFLSVVILSGCASAQAPRLTYEGHAVVATTGPNIVDAVVTVRNTGSKTANLRRPICPIRIAAYSTPERNTQPVWSSGEDSCITFPMIYPPISIGPLDYFDFAARVTLPSELVGKPLYLVMRLPFAGVPPVPVGQVMVRPDPSRQQ